MEIKSGKDLVEFVKEHEEELLNADVMAEDENSDCMCPFIYMSFLEEDVEDEYGHEAKKGDLFISIGFD